MTLKNQRQNLFMKKKNLQIWLDSLWISTDKEIEDKFCSQVNFIIGFDTDTLSMCCFRGGGYHSNHAFCILSQRSDLVHDLNL